MAERAATEEGALGERPRQRETACADEATFLAQDVIVFAAAARHGAPVDQTSLVLSRGVSIPLRRPPAGSAAAVSRAEYDVRRQGLHYAGQDQRVDGVSERAIMGVYLNGLHRLRLGPLSEVLATSSTTDPHGMSWAEGVAIHKDSARSARAPEQRAMRSRSNGRRYGGQRKRCNAATTHNYWGTWTPQPKGVATFRLGVSRKYKPIATT